ncbi:DMT family transporter [Paenibacillus psychroresistens]|uniref:DMT family transporter n=1 Tax=Paenibacillus psychroresistens TaxID=1778678 RepID=A0A6B8RE75_9BACL|nr:DMT family transporter [Paenibacillus psychroresistens]QGQ94024.1 DMT family transporter [Paenibacillus psychroresistens]
MSKREKIIYAILVAVVITWGLNVVMIKYLTEFIPPMLVVAIRMPLAGVALLFFAWMKYGLYRPTSRQWLLLFYVALTTIFIHQIFMSYGVVSTSATNASLILGLNPLVTALLASLVLTNERLHWKLGIGAVLGFSGVVLAVTSKSVDSSVGISGWGDGIMVVSMLGFVVGGLLVKQVMTTNIPILVVTAYSTMLGGIMINLGAIFVIGPSGYGELHLSATAWGVMFMSAWGASSIGTIGWNYGIKAFGAGRTALFLNGLPFASMIGGALFLGERIRFIHFIAFVLTVLGIIIGTRKRKEPLNDLSHYETIGKS